MLVACRSRYKQTVTRNESEIKIRDHFSGCTVAQPSAHDSLKLTKASYDMTLNTGCRVICVAATTVVSKYMCY